MFVSSFIQQEKHVTLKLPNLNPNPSIHIILNQDFLWNSNRKQISIRACCDKTTIEPVTTKNGDIMLFFLGRLFDQIDILDLYCKYGIHYVLKKLKGTYAFILLDHSCDQEESLLYVVTDSFNTIPIYYYQEPGTNIVEFNTKSNTYNQITIPQASYCKMTYSNKVSSMWTFDHESYIPNYDRNLKKWIYPSPKFRFHKYRTLHASHIFSNRTTKEIVRQLDEYIRSAIQLRIQNLKGPIICIGNSNDPEYHYMTSVIKETHQIYEIDTEQHIEEIKNKIKEIRSIDPPIICMSFGIFSKEINTCKNIDFTESPIEEFYTYYDVNFYEFLETSITEFYHKEYDVSIEFPLLDESWIQYYLSIPPKIRYTESLFKYLLHNL